MALTPYEPTTWVNDSEPDLDATNLNKVEQGIKDAIDGVNGILSALTNQLSADPDKYAGIAVVNQLNTALNDLSNTVSTLNSNLDNVNSNLMFKGNTTDFDVLINDTSYTDKIIFNTFHYNIAGNPAGGSAGIVITHYISDIYVTQRVLSRSGTDYSRTRSGALITDWVNPIEQLSNDLALKANKDAIQIDWLDQIRRSGLYTITNKAYTPDDTKEFTFQAISQTEGSWIVWLTAYQLYDDHVYVSRMTTTDGNTYTVGTWHQLF